MPREPRVLLVIATFVLCSCKKDPGADTNGSASAAGSGIDEKRGVVDKINIYVGCLNSMNSVVRGSLKDYAAWADLSAGPTLDKAGRGIAAVGRETTYGYDCFKKNGGLDTIDGKLPKIPELDKAGAAYKRALLAVMDVTGKAHTYYDHKDYKDDKLANGKAMHKPLLDAFGAFDRATGELESVLQTIQDKMNADDLVELEKAQGKKARWHQHNVMRNAEMFMRVLGDEPKLGPAIEVFVKSFQDMKAWTDGNKAEADKNVSWGTFVSDADGLLTQVKELSRGLRDQHKAPTSGDGSREGILRKYNDLVTVSNDLWAH